MKKTLLSILALLWVIISHGQVTDGLVDKYSFNNGNANDEIGSNNGTVYGATLTSDRFGNANKAYLFINGDYITLPNAPSLKSSVMTVSLWVRIDSFAYSTTPYYQDFIYSIINSSTNNYFGSLALSINTSDQKYFSVTQNSPGQSVQDESINVSTYKWQHYVLSFDDDSFKMYIDGKEQWSLYKGFTTTFTSDLIYIGKSGNTSYQGNLNGAVDDIRVYNRVLDSIEVNSLFHEKNPVNTTGINETSSVENNLKMYPNPTSGKLYWSNFLDVEVTDAVGRVIAIKENTNVIDLSNLPPDIYFIIFRDKKRGIVNRREVIKTN